MTHDDLDANLDSAIDHLETVLRELASAREALALLHSQDEDATRLRAWRETLIDLGVPLHLGSHALHRAIRELAVRVGDDPSEPEFSWWLTGIPARPYVAPVTAEMVLAEALQSWLTPKVAQLPPRLRTLLTRNFEAVIRGQAGALTGLDNEGFLRELRRPNGGQVGLMAGLGPWGLKELRSVLGIEHEG